MNKKPTIILDDTKYFVQFNEATILTSRDEYKSFEQLCVLEHFGDIIRKFLWKGIKDGGFYSEDLYYIKQIWKDEKVLFDLSQDMFFQIPKYLDYFQDEFIDYLQAYYDPKELGVDLTEFSSESEELKNASLAIPCFLVKEKNNSGITFEYNDQQYSLSNDIFKKLKKKVFQEYCLENVLNIMSHSEYAGLKKLSKNSAIVLELTKVFNNALGKPPILDIELLEPYFEEDSEPSISETRIQTIFSRDFLKTIRPSELEAVSEALNSLKEQLFEFEKEPWFDRLVEICDILVSDYLDPQDPSYSPAIAQMLRENSGFLQFIVDELPMNSYAEESDYWFDTLLAKAAVYFFEPFEYVYVDTDVVSYLKEVFDRQAEVQADHSEDLLILYQDTCKEDKELKIVVDENTGQVKLQLYEKDQILSFEEEYYPKELYYPLYKENPEKGKMNVPALLGYWGVKYEGQWYGVHFMPMSRKIERNKISNDPVNQRSYEKIVMEHSSKYLGHDLEYAFETILDLDAMEYYSGIIWDYDE